MWSVTTIDLVFLYSDIKSLPCLLVLRPVRADGGDGGGRLTSPADTKESVEAMLMVSFRQESSRSSRLEMSVCLSGRETGNSLELGTCTYTRERML